MKGIYFILSDTLVFRPLCQPEFMSQNSKQYRTSPLKCMILC